MASFQVDTLTGKEYIFAPGFNGSSGGTGGSTITGVTNLGSGTAVLLNTTGGTITARSLSGGTNVTLDVVSGVIRINSTASGGGAITYGTPITHTGSTLSIDWDNGHRVVTLNTGVTTLDLTGGTVGALYKLVFVQDSTGGRTLTIGPDWASGTTYSIGDIVKSGSVYYRANSGHTAGASFNSSVFDIYITTEQKIDITLSLSANAEDFIYVEHRDTDRYILYPVYDTGV